MAGQPVAAHLQAAVDPTLSVGPGISQTCGGGWCSLLSIPPLPSQPRRISAFLSPRFFKALCIYLYEVPKFTQRFGLWKTVQKKRPSRLSLFSVRPQGSPGALSPAGVAAQGTGQGKRKGNRAHPGRKEHEFICQNINHLLVCEKKTE